jgi:hypothetical protein
MSIIGITWNKSVLVSFDPSAGVITAKHAWLDPNQNFVGLAYDYGRNTLYALSQVSRNLYSINPLTRDVTLIGQLTISGDDVSGLAYDASSGSLYTLIVHLGTPLRTDLATVNPDNLQITVVGTMANVLGESLCWRDSDGQLNAYTVQGSGSWDSPYKASIVTIDPRTAALTVIFQTPYHTILGLAKKPGENAYFSWVNWTSHFYADVNLNSKQITQLGNSDPVGVVSGAMIAKTFYVAPAPNLPPCSFSDNECLGL